MKLKGLLKSLCILGLTLLPISFINAYEFVGYGGQLEITLPDTAVVGNYVYVFNNNGNIATDGYGNVLNWYNRQNNNNYNYIYGWIDGKLYFAGFYNNSVQKQGFVQKFSVCDESEPTSSSKCINLSITADEFYNLSPNITKLIVGATSANLQSFYGNEPFRLCYYNSNDSKYYCVQNAIRTDGYVDNPLSGSLSFTNIDSLSNGNWGSTPFSPSSKPIEYYYSTGSCPSVGQLKAGSNLTPAVCYAGYDGELIYTAGENTTIQAGSGLNLFETYALFSGNMTIQNWYDTYWTYYNNISFNPYPFYNKPKALLGLMVARQSAGLTRGLNGSYIILNYCYYVLNNIPDNTSTCVGSNVSTQYTGITLTDQDKKDLIDMVNDNYTVHTPGSGSIFLDPSQGLGGGGSSWGDKCESIPCLFDKFYQMFTSSRINDVDFSQGGQGILPGYIALAFVVVVLFYVFKR